MSELTVERDGPNLALEGELDLAGVAVLESAIAAAREEGAEEVVVDLRELEFMDSSGLRCLVQADERAREDGWRLTLVRGPAGVHRIFEITRMDQRLTFVER